MAEVRWKFGSFYYLKHLPFDYFKIDGDFVRGFGNNTTDQLVVEAIVGIAKGMGKKTVAEFVTDQDMMDKLRRSGVDYAQGFHIGIPSRSTSSFSKPLVSWRSCLRCRRGGRLEWIPRSRYGRSRVVR